MTNNRYFGVRLNSADSLEATEAIFTLANGDEISVAFHERLSVEGLSLMVHQISGPAAILLTVPRASNALELFTGRSKKAQDEAIDKVVADRRARTGS